jgi:hypothetical protein
MPSAIETTAGLDINFPRVPGLIKHLMRAWVAVFAGAEGDAIKEDEGCGPCPRVEHAWVHHRHDISGRGSSQGLFLVVILLQSVNASKLSPVMVSNPEVCLAWGVASPPGELLCCRSAQKYCWIARNLSQQGQWMSKAWVQIGLWQQATRCVVPQALVLSGAGAAFHSQMCKVKRIVMSIPHFA